MTGKRRTGGYAVNDDGLTELQVQILMLLEEGGRSFSEIGEIVGRSKQHVHQVKKRLEEMGMLNDQIGGVPV